MELTGAQILCESLLREGVEVVFGIPGGAILPLYDTLPQYPRLRHILMRHEQCAAHAADGYARALGGIGPEARAGRVGRVGVCFATSGPGATNLVTGIANAWMDSIPIVAITGQVTRSLIGRDGFQEADITGITLPVTKHNYLVLHAADLSRVVREAFHIARSGRPGPVLIDIPRDVFQERSEFLWPEQVEPRGHRPRPRLDSQEVEKAAKLVAQAQRPLILAGHGVILAQAYGELLELAERAQTPVITTLLGIGSFPSSHALHLGMPGMHGMYWNNIAISEADLLIAIGMRFDDRITGRLHDFAAKARIVHIDVDPAEVGKNVRPDAAPLGDVKEVLQALNAAVAPQEHREWLAYIQELQEKHPYYVPDGAELLPQYVIQKVYEASGDDFYAVTGVGQHQMWAAQLYRSDRPGRFITSGGLGTMGFCLPASMGAQFAAPGSLVWAIDGDGSFQMTLQDLATIAEHELPIKFAIMDNGYLGMVRQWQTLFYKDNRVATGLRNPDFVKIAEAYGLLGLRVTTRHQVEEAIATALAHPGAAIIDFRVKEDENCFPMVPPGAALHETIDLPRLEEAHL
ncbi:MAG TPA: biosynthetic-type acetolactate synthase large subunit [Dehalococcoidia bacterium]|nr:biosynthetic-type acetolactate synthase large subunit [Dehalococcoidia bacterium]